jgi:arginine repressor
VIDNISPASVVGTLAGDNTIFVAVDSKDNVGSVLRVFEEAVSSEEK